MVNFVYHENPSNVCPYFLYRGLKEALERNGLLSYSFNLSDQKDIDMQALAQYPVLFVRGYAKMYELIVKCLFGKTRLAMIETETPINKDGTKNISYDRMEKMSRYFDVVFHEFYQDGGYFGKKTKGYAGMVPLEIYDSVDVEPMFDVGFVGNVVSESRKEFVRKTPFIMHSNNEEQKTQLDHVLAYVSEMKKYRFLVSAPASTSEVGFSQRALEYMACKRLCFEYFDPSNQKNLRNVFRDKDVLVYWSSYDELRELIDHYLERTDEADRIAQNGYDFIKNNYTDDIQAKRFVDAIYNF